MKKKQIDDDAVLVVGLGRFGTAIASTLDGLGREVLQGLGLGEGVEAAPAHELAYLRVEQRGSIHGRKTSWE